VTARSLLGTAAAVTLVVAAAAACSDSASKAASPVPTAPTATVTVTASSSATPTPTPTLTPTLTPTPAPTPTESAPPPVTPTPASDPAAPPATYAEALAHVAAAQDVSNGGADRVARFTTPSGNIFCDLDLAACELGSGQVDDPSACPGGMTTRVGRIELQGNQPVAVCNTDTIVQPGAQVLAYGQSVTTRDTQCVSETIGVTCVARGAETGFFLAKGRYQLITS
jgi:hypothetical protein